jgi:glycosyltransferase involved in cell wall biosynthesis
MNILIISTYFPPQPSIASLRAFSFAKYWTQLGHNVTVLTTKKIDSGNKNLNIPQDKFKVIEVPYLYNIICEGEKTFRKLLRQIYNHSRQDAQIVGSSMGMVNDNKSLLGLKHVVNKLRSLLGLFVIDRIPDVNDTWILPAVIKIKKMQKMQGFDWIFSSYAPPASHLVAGFLSKKYSIKWVADYRDLWIENHVWVGKWPFTALEKYLEKKYIGNYAKIITIVSEPLANILRKKFTTPVHVIENGYDEDDYNQNIPSYFKDKKKRIVYTGTLYPGMRDPSPLFAAIGLIAKKIKGNHPMSDFEILFFGRQEDWLDNLIKKYKVAPWVKYMGRVVRDDVLRIQNQADILLFLEWENDSVDGILTGKLFEYLAQRKPILGVGVTAKTSPGALIEEAGVGVAVGTDIEKIVSIIENFLDTGIPFDIHPNEDIITKYTRRNQAEKLLQLMKNYDN